MNADRLNMIAGSVIGALLLFLLLGFFSSQIYGTFAVGHHEPPAQAFAVEVETPTEENTAGTDYATLVAEADSVAGGKIFKKCGACHKIDDGANGVGPHLHGVVGRQIASVGDFSYSPALSGKSGEVWDLQHLTHFLENPKGYAPGTKMGFAGLKKPEDRVNLIAWLNEHSDAPIDLSEGLEPAAAEGDAEPAATEEPAAEEPASDDKTEAPAETEVAAAPADAEEPAAEEPAADDKAEAPAETEVAAAPASGGGEYAELIAAADVDKGKKAFKKCRACHKLEAGKNGVGPSLHDIVGRDVASIDGFSYSPAMAEHGGQWTVSELMHFLEKPKAYIKGTKMSFAGVKKPQQRMDIIVYLNSESDNPVPLE